MLSKPLRLLAGILFVTLPVCGGQYSQDFNSFALGTTNFGDGSQLAFLLPDLDPGAVVGSFSASWVAPVYGPFPNASFGFSFTFGPLRTNDLAGASYAQ